MMTNLDLRILTRACGLEWHYLVSDKFGALDHYTCSCGKEYVSKGAFYEHLVRSGVTFSTPDDWELVKVRVVIPNKEDFRPYLKENWTIFEWIGNTPEQCCQLVCNWIKSRPDLFPWVVELM